MAPVVKALKACQDLNAIVAVSGQHRQMLDQVLELFEIKPDVDLNIMKANQDLADITARVLSGMRDTIQAVKADAILVHGDTTTALASAMAGFYLDIPVGHVEAGLRTFNLKAPFPEEFNRQVISKLAHWHFAPTEKSRQNLLAESVPEDHVYVTGNTVIDALQWTVNRLDQDCAIDVSVNAPHSSCSVAVRLNALLPFQWRQTRFILMTGHRRENFGDGFIQICDAVAEIANRYPDVHVVYPVHLNPNVQAPVMSRLGNYPNVHLIEPLDYEPFAMLLKHSYLVLTDSGGIQEEAPSLGKPVLVMRQTTERPEAVEAGTVRLVGTDRKTIVREVCELLDNELAYNLMSRAHNPYGDGHASARIAAVMRAWAQA